MDAAERIEDGLQIPAHLEAIFMDGTALGGARPKACVRDEHGVLRLAKFSSLRDGFDVPAIECAALRLAAAAGLTAPPVEVRTLGARKVMRIRRFVRLGRAGPDARCRGRPDGDPVRFANGTLSVTAVPEPHTWALMLGGLLAVGWFKRRALGA